MNFSFGCHDGGRTTANPVLIIVKKKVIVALFPALFLAVFTVEPVAAQKGDTSVPASAPRLTWGLSLDTQFDNHERDALALPTTRSQTFFSIRAMPVIGVAWGVGHSVKAGGSLMLDMGAKPGGRPIEPLLYYSYSSPLYSLYAGKFERKHLIGAYSRAMLAGVMNFYDTVIDGLAMQYHAPQGSLELVLDWDGMASETKRESFRITSAGEFNPVKAHSLRWFAMGYSYDMYHLASRRGAIDGVVDHNSVNPWIGARFHRLFPWFENLILEAGWLQTFDRDRHSGQGWLKPGGLTVDVGVQKWKIGIRNRFYSGEKQMPLYASYGSRIYKGDGMYASAGRYNYTQVYWRPAIGQGVKLNLELGFHSDLCNMAFHQILGVGVTLDGNFFRRK